MTRFFCFLSVIICCLIIFGGCKKDASISQLNTEQFGDRQVIADAKEFFKNNVEKKAAYSTTLDQLASARGTLLNPVKSLIKNVDWDKAYVQKITSGNMIVVPIKFQDRMYLRPFKASKFISLSVDDFYKLIVYTDNKSQFHAEVVTSVPDTTFFKIP